MTSYTFQLECSVCKGSPVQFKGMCASCNTAARKAERNAHKVKKATPINKVSEKRAKELLTYKELSNAHLKSHPHCQVKIMGVCDNRNLAVHHTEGRGVNLNKSESFLTACLACHSFLHDRMSAAERKERGLLA